MLHLPRGSVHLRLGALTMSNDIQRAIERASKVLPEQTAKLVIQRIADMGEAMAALPDVPTFTGRLVAEVLALPEPDPWGGANLADSSQYSDEGIELNYRNYGQERRERVARAIANGDVNNQVPDAYDTECDWATQQHYLRMADAALDAMRGER